MGAPPFTATASAAPGGPDFLTGAQGHLQAGELDAAAHSRLCEGFRQV